MTARSCRVLVLFGTRPEVIKLAPVIRALRVGPDPLGCRVVFTGQHREMVSMSLSALELQLDIQLDVMADAVTLGQLTGRLFQDLDRLLASERPEWVVVQGDTTSAMVAAMVAYYHRIRIAHVEAGLRTANRWSPFPEEVNRTIIGHVADLHFAPTESAANALRSLGIPSGDIHITGNTVVDSLLWMKQRISVCPPRDLAIRIQGFAGDHRLVLVTCHRRESFGVGIKNVCDALLALVATRPEIRVVFPVHMNPNVGHAIRGRLGNHPHILLLEPLAYPEMVWLMVRSHFILTDSGGIQEEAPSLGKPVLIMRDNTERPEVLRAGCGRLVGTNTTSIVEAATQLLTDGDAYAAMANVVNPFGDGKSAGRIVNEIRARCR